MLHKRLLVLSIAIFLLVVTLIALPTITTQSSFCSNSISAQDDDACLAEKATISALQVKLQQVSFQATLDTINNQVALTAMSSMAGVDFPATIAALENELDALKTSGGVEIPPTPVTGLPFVESFDDNSQGWDLTGGVTITRGELVLFGGGDAIIPFEVVGNFRLEVDARAALPGRSPFYVGFGDISSNNWHQMVYNHSSIVLYSVIGDSAEEIFSVDHSTSYNQTYRIGIEYAGGQLEIYVNGALVSIAQVTKLGNQLLLGKGGSSSDDEVYFDNLVVHN